MPVSSKTVCSTVSFSTGGAELFNSASGFVVRKIPINAVIKTRGRITQSQVFCFCSFCSFMPLPQKQTSNLIQEIQTDGHGTYNFQPQSL